MKKPLLLLLFLFLILNIFAQPPGMFPPQTACDDSSNDGFAVFDLASTIPIVLEGLDPGIHEVHFYPSDTDSANNTNEIITLNAYVNSVSGLQTLGIRIINTALSETHFAGMNLVVDPLPTANPANLTFCDLVELAIYNLNDAIGQLTNGSAGLTVTFYETQANAEMGIAPINPNGYVPLVNPGIQILFARVQNATSGCFTVTTLTLDTQNCAQNCEAPTNLAAAMITNTSVTFSWTSPGTTTLWEVLILPSTAPTPGPTTPGIFAQTNPFTFTGLSPQNCYSFYVRAVCANSVNGTWSSALNFCTYDCTNNGQCPESLTLVSFLDTNSNGVKDVGENGINIGNFEYEINNSGTTLFGYPDDGVFYIFDNNPTNAYDMAFTVDGNYAAYFSSATTYSNITLPTGSGSSTYYFPIIQLQSLNDLEVQITPNGSPRPGFTYGNTIAYKNKGTQTLSSGTLSFMKSPVVSITNVSQTGTTTTATGFDYTFSNLAPNEQRYIYVEMQVPTIPTVALGDIVTNSVTIEPLVGDAFPANNNAGLSQAIVGSYDPNDKVESHGGKIVFDDFTANDYLYYTVQFENTGTANAAFIRIEDALHDDLDESTFEMLDASHPVNTRREGNQLTWHFFDIDLPPSSINIDGGHGFVSFRIKPSAGYAIGDVIPNTASIFFDYNPPIVTNTFNTEFVAFLGAPDFDTNSIVFYPNPAHDFITISSQMENMSHINIYELNGKRIYSANGDSANEMRVDLARFAKGLYLLELTTADNHKINKKLIIK